MAGIMIPISLNAGRQRALEDNRGDELAEQQRQLNEKRMQGLDMDMRRSQMALDDAEQGAPLRKMKRDAEMISQIAKFGAANLERVSDEDLPEYMAQLLSDMPAYGRVQVQGGKLFDGEKSIPIDRRTAMAILQGFSDPEKAMQLKMQESPYINEQGKVETMTAGEAQQRGLGLATDQVASYGLNKARVEDQFAEEKAGLDVRKTRAEVWKLNAEAQKDRAEGMGGYKFSPQNAGAVESDAYDSYLADLGYQFSVVSDGITSSKQWTKGGKAAEISPEDHAAARDFAALTSGILATGQAQSVPHARVLAMQLMPPASPRTETVTGADGKEYVQARQGDPGARQAKGGSWWKEAESGSRGLEFLDPPSLIERMLGNANLSGIVPEARFEGSGRPTGVTTKAESRKTENLAAIIGNGAPPMKGAKLAEDGHWYVRTGTKNGNPVWSRVVQK